MTCTNELDVWPECDNVSSLKRVNLKMAKLEFLEHVQFLSVYFRDPDNFRPEITMPVA